MKRVLMVLFFAFAAATATYAQKDTTTHAKKTKAATHNTADTAHKKVSPMKQIGLTKTQEQKLKTANKDYKTKSKSIKADTTLSASDRKAKIKALTNEKKQAQDTILTPVQKAKLKELKDAKKKNATPKSKTAPKK